MKKKIISTTIMLSVLTLCGWAQPMDKGKAQVGHFKYQFVVNSLDSSAVKLNNGNLQKIENSGKRGIGTAILAGLASSFVQKTVNASSNLLNLGVSYITDALHKPSKNFAEWQQALSNQCKHTESISTDNQIDDFYYLGSTNGALDPRDMKFNGFTCRNYIDIGLMGVDNTGSGQALGHDAFLVSCKLRTDSIGISHMANHSKFMLAVDSLVFYPNFCNLRNDSTDANGTHFIFDKRKDLKFQMKIKLYSSWVNEAIMFTSDQLLGEFTINADIPTDALVVQQRGQQKDSVFIFNGKDALSDGTRLKTKNLVSISGESFIVPRSFVGTINEPRWGTGQYRLEIEVTECCQPNPEYYVDAEKAQKYNAKQQKKQAKEKSTAAKGSNKDDDRKVQILQTGNGPAVNYAHLMGNRKYIKDIWKTEWRTITERRKGDSFWTNAWSQIKIAYIGNNWVQEVVSPITTVLLDEESTQLHKLLDLNKLQKTNAASGASNQKGGAANGNTGAAGMTMPAPTEQPAAKPDNTEVQHP